MTHVGENIEQVSRKSTSVCVGDILRAGHEAALDVARTNVMTLPILNDSMSEAEIDQMVENATRATNFLKAIGHEGRLLILCHLASGEKSVAELERLLSARQAAVSQQLGRLRLEGLVKPRRDGKTIFYSLADDRCKKIISVVYDLFCRTD